MAWQLLPVQTVIWIQCKNAWCHHCHHVHVIMVNSLSHTSIEYWISECDFFQLLRTRLLRLAACSATKVKQNLRTKAIELPTSVSTNLNAQLWWNEHSNEWCSYNCYVMMMLCNLIGAANFLAAEVNSLRTLLLPQKGYEWGHLGSNPNTWGT